MVYSWRLSQDIQLGSTVVNEAVSRHFNCCRQLFKETVSRHLIGPYNCLKRMSEDIQLLSTVAHRDIELGPSFVFLESSSS